MSVVYPTKYKKEQADGRFGKVIPMWSMSKDLKNQRLEYSEIKPPSPYPPNRRKPGVTLPVGGRLPYKIILTETLPDIEKEPVKSLNEVEPRKANVKGGKGKKGKKGKKK